MMMMEVEKQEIASSSLSSQRKRKRRNENQVVAPSSFPNDVVEEIFLRLPVKTLIQLKSLSNQWRFTIESHNFVEGHSKIAHVDHLKLMSISQHSCPGRTNICFETICQESGSRLSWTPLEFPQQLRIYHSESCNGLFCIYSLNSPSMFVVNPTTRWSRQLPSPQCLIEKFREAIFVAFVKAADYKLVSLYNSYGSSPYEGVTKCEVFDFRANRWRYLTCTPSYRVFAQHRPAFANESLYWFTEKYNGEVKVVAFDIHTENFRLLPKIHTVIASSDPEDIDMCTLDHHLCMSTRESNSTNTNKKIWRLNSSEDMWEEIYTIELRSCSSFCNPSYYRVFLTPVTICKNKKILLLDRESNRLVKYDPQRKTLHLLSEHEDYRYLNQPSRSYVPYFQSLISHI